MVSFFNRAADYLFAAGKRGRALRILALAAAIGGAGARLPAATTVSLVADPPGTAPVGTMITWSAQVGEAPSADLWYRFRAREAGGEFRMIRDFGPLNALAWT